jgi:hypothetical protein
MAAQDTHSLADEFAQLTDDEQAERMHNAATFAEIPRTQCPWENVRLALKVRALAGHDCYAYRPAHQEEYVIWDRQPDPATESRFSPGEWGVRMGYLREYLNADGTLRYGHPRYWIVQANGTLTDRTDGKEAR